MGTGESIIDSSICVAMTMGLPSWRQMRRMRFCTPGTRSGGSSTPRSPRATITASDTRTISSSCCSAAGFSILDSTPARVPIISRASAMSEGRCTKDSAIQSAPSSSAKARSRRSFSVSAGIGITASGTFTPLRSDSVPLLATRVVMLPLATDTMLSRTLPSSISSDCPALAARNSSGCGR
ncbi:hypothetical protein D3C86_1463690 [compost metagenome]